MFKKKFDKIGRSMFLSVGKATVGVRSGVWEDICDDGRDVSIKPGSGTGSVVTDPV